MMVRCILLFLCLTLLVLLKTSTAYAGYCWINSSGICYDNYVSCSVSCPGGGSVSGTQYVQNIYWSDGRYSAVIGACYPNSACPVFQLPQCSSSRVTSVSGPAYNTCSNNVSVSYVVDQPAPCQTSSGSYVQSSNNCAGGYSCSGGTCVKDIVQCSISRPTTSSIRYDICSNNVVQNYVVDGPAGCTGGWSGSNVSSADYCNSYIAGYQCQSGACVPPPPPSISSFTVSPGSGYTDVAFNVSVSVANGNLADIWIDRTCYVGQVGSGSSRAVTLSSYSTCNRSGNHTIEAYPYNSTRGVFGTASSSTYNASGPKPVSCASVSGTCANATGLTANEYTCTSYHPEVNTGCAAGAYPYCFTGCTPPPTYRCVPNPQCSTTVCNAPEPACGQTTWGTYQALTAGATCPACSKTGGTCPCFDTSCNAAEPACGQTTFGKTNCNNDCSKVGNQCVQPFLKTSGGDVHSNTNINTPGGPQ